jgi:hypothetical protein
MTYSCKGLLKKAERIERRGRKLVKIQPIKITTIKSREDLVKFFAEFDNLQHKG